MAFSAYVREGDFFLKRSPPVSIKICFFCGVDINVESPCPTSINVMV